MPTHGYREVADELRAAIVRGDYAPGTTIPREADLSTHYGLGRDAIRRAVAVLRAEGLVVPIRRRGTVVRDRTPVRLSISRYSDALTSGDRSDRGPWETACAEQGIAGRTEIVVVEQASAPESVAERLQLPPETPVIYRRQHMYAGTQIAQIQQAWIPLSIADGTPLASDGKVVGGIYRALARLGRPPAVAEEDVTSRMPTRAEADTMSLDIGTPVVEIRRTTRDLSGLVLALVVAVADGDRVQLHYLQTLDPGASR